MSYDPNATGNTQSGLFGLPYNADQSKLWLIPCPFDVTTSFGSGTSLGPEAIFKSSPQIDLDHLEATDIYQQGFYWQNQNHAKRLKMNRMLKPMAKKIQDQLELGQALNTELKSLQSNINEQMGDIQEDLYQECQQALAQNKTLGVVGGDHSSPLGLIRALSEKYQGDFSILHVDAHTDLRLSYQGFEHSHASIMNNVMKLPLAPQSLSQIGIRDFCPQEREFINKNSKVHTFYDSQVWQKIYNGSTWQKVLQEVLSTVSSNNVYLSMDIDGLTPDLCPNTGTPVPGGLSWNHLISLLSQVARSKNIIGFDLCEVAPESESQLEGWDGNVGSRVLYQLSCYTLWSHEN